MILSGNYEFNRDSKGRIQIPSEIRDLMIIAFRDRARRLVMTQGPNRCINAFMPETHEKYIERMHDLPLDSDDSLLQMRRFAYGSSDCRIDSNWRVVLPEPLVEYAKIKKNVVILGFFDRIEIWNPDELKRSLRIKEMNEDKDSDGYDTFIRKVLKPMRRAQMNDASIKDESDKS